MEPLASPIHIPISSSPSISRLVVAGHLLIVALLVLGFRFGFYLAVGTAAMMASFYLQYRNTVQLRTRVAAIFLRSDGQWNIVSPEGAIADVKAAKCLFVSPYLVVLRILPIAEPALHIVLSHDNTSADSFRRLRVRLRFPG